VYLECLGAVIIDAFRGVLVGGGKRLETTVGTVLAGRYKVESTLGSGGMAVVYRAEDDILGRAVALKTLHHEYAEVPSFRRRFRQEARAMASLDHQNIVKVYDISQDGEVPFIVVECIAGRDVGDLLANRRGGRLNEQFTKRMAEQLLLALSYAHRRGIIHRDIKPSNILLTQEGSVKVADFGIARIIEEDDAGGAPGEIVGSARYMSPEQLRGEDATPRSDVYSVGVLLYHCLTGRPPFSGDVKSLARQHIHKDPTPPRKLNRRISPQMEAVILKALQKDPRDRYFSASAMLDDIEIEAPRKKTAEASRPSRRKARGAGFVFATMLAVMLILGGGAALASGLIGLPQGGEVAETLSRMNPVETKPPDPPQNANEAAQDVTDGQSGSQNVASVTQTKSSDKPDQPEKVPVPDVTAYYDYYAADALTNSGFKIDYVRDYREGFAARGVTWATDPAAGSLAPEGSTVTIYATPKDLPLPPRLR
jgi:eukaryotic-like serine/threonine-protein kinase